MTPWPGPTHPTGPAGPGPSGPAGPGPQPSGPAPGGPQQPSPTSGTGAPWPSRPQGPTGPGGPAGPGRGLASLVADAETMLSGPLHLLVAAVLEMEDCTVVQRARLAAAAQDITHALAELARIESPARQVVGAHADDTLSAPGGPGPKPSVPVAEKELTPSSAAAAGTAVRESLRPDTTPEAGADVPGFVRTREGRAVGADGAATFQNPKAKGAPRFDRVLAGVATYGRPALDGDPLRRPRRWE